MGVPHALRGGGVPDAGAEKGGGGGREETDAQRRVVSRPPIPSSFFKRSPHPPTPHPPFSSQAFIDSTGSLWAAGALAGKPAAAITSTATIGGGAEATILTFLPFLAHMGMLYVPAGYAAGPQLFGFDEIRGGSPWGASTLAGADGKRKPVALELAIAEGQVNERERVCVCLCERAPLSCVSLRRERGGG